MKQKVLVSVDTEAPAGSLPVERMIYGQTRDGKEYGIDVLGKNVSEYLSPLVFTGVISRYSHRLADARCHSVDVRRYMWHVEY